MLQRATLGKAPRKDPTVSENVRISKARARAKGELVGFGAALGSFNSILKRRMKPLFWVELASPQGMTALCTLLTARVDVLLPFEIAFVDASIGRTARLQRSPREGPRVWAKAGIPVRARNRGLPPIARIHRSPSGPSRRADSERSRSERVGARRARVFARWGTRRPFRRASPPCRPW